MVLAFVVWNVVYDRVIVLAGRRYVHDASVLFDTTGRPLLIGDVMGPAAARGLKVASASASGVLLTGGVGIWWAVRRKGRSGESALPSENELRPGAGEPGA